MNTALRFMLAVLSFLILVFEAQSLTETRIHQFWFNTMTKEPLKSSHLVLPSTDIISKWYHGRLFSLWNMEVELKIQWKNFYQPNHLYSLFFSVILFINVLLLMSDQSSDFKVIRSTNDVTEKT